LILTSKTAYQKIKMDKKNLWGVCEHILTGSASEALLRPDKIALCKRCTVELPPESFQTVYENRLKDLIKDIDIIGGMEFLDK
jgi:hypothetical protein